MPSDHPWPDTKAALAAVAKAATRLEEAQAQNAPDTADAEHAFHRALEDYERARAWRGVLMDGAQVRITTGSANQPEIRLNRDPSRTA